MRRIDGDPERWRQFLPTARGQKVPKSTAPELSRSTAATGRDRVISDFSPETTRD